MKKMSIGVMLDSFRLGINDGIKKAKEVGASGIQVYAISGEMSPENLSAGRKKEILDMVKANGMVVSAVCSDLGGHGFTVAEDNAWKIEKSKRIMDLALELECSVVTTHIGVVPEDKWHPRWSVLQEACEILGEYGEKTGAFFAIETGPETSSTLRSFLDSLGSRGVKVNLDPANLVMVTGDDPVKAVFTLKDYIVHTHAKDGKMFKKIDAERLYGNFTLEGNEDFNPGEYFLETPLGEGCVDFNEYLKALSAINYNGFLTIEREVGENPEKDIRAAVEFLNKRLKTLNFI